MQIRPARETDLERIVACRVTEPISAVSEEKYRQNAAARSYRPEWTWIAEDGDRILARAVWWGFPDGNHPLELDCLYADPSVGDPVALCAQLVSRVVDDVPPDRAAPSYHLFLPHGWRDDPEAAAAVRWRLRAAERAGLAEVVERLRYEWTRGAAVPERSSRLRFAAEPDEAVWTALFQRVAEQSLDAETRREVRRLGSEQQARASLADYRMPPARSDWWRVAYAGDEPIGFAMPSCYEGGHVVAYLGVVPAQRGHGYVHDLLAEITHLLIEQGADRIVADVDLANAPMVAALDRAAFRSFGVRIVASRPT